MSGTGMAGLPASTDPAPAPDVPEPDVPEPDVPEPSARPRSLNLRRWLTPGIGVKRWLLVVFAGLLLLALGVAHMIRQATRDLQPGGVAQVLLDLVTLQFLPYQLRGLLVAGAGLALVGFGAYRTVRALTDPFRPVEGGPLVELIYQRRSLARGPRTVAIGGGTGLSTLLRGLKEHTSNLTAIVAVGDDGGSSGVLRQELGIPPVGDIRRCLAALAESEPAVGRVLEYRFPGTANDPSPEAGGALGGHAVGNLLLAAMTELADGDFVEAVRRMNRVLAVRGQVVPATATPLTLHARLQDGTVLDGQSTISGSAGIERLWISPTDGVACEDALIAIAEADLIVLGPGSLYTSLLPSLLLPQIRDAIVAAPALRVFVCNVATQRGETTGMDLAGHLEALVAHVGPELVDTVVANSQLRLGAGQRLGSLTRTLGERSGEGPPADAPASDPAAAEPVRLRWPAAITTSPRLALEDVVDHENPHHHDPERLAAAIIRAWERDGGSRRRPGAARTA